MTDLCPTDEELLAVASGDTADSQLRLHVESCETCRTRMQQLRSEVDALRSIRDLPRFSDSGGGGTVLVDGERTGRIQPAAYERIGRYVVIGEIASGGQANVFRVIDPELARPLVLKLSRRVVNGDDTRRHELIAEGRLLAALDHPGLVRVFDIGVFEQHPYLVLEYVPGRTLEQCFLQQRASPAEAARLSAEAAEVLAYAHRQGVVHGDVTPRNIMIDAEGRVRLIDFGLSRLEQIWKDDLARVGGTPEFLAPELLEQDATRAGPASDVFGLGATLFWLLTGHGPFAADNVIGALERVRTGEVDFTPLQTARTPRRLMRFLQAALARDPAQRPSAAESAKQLALAAKRAWTARGRIGAVVVVLAALFCVGLGPWMLNQVTDSWRARNRTQLLSLPDVMVVRENEVVNLKSVLPLRTGDRFSMSFLVEPREPVTAIWLDAAGHPRILPTVRVSHDEVDRMQYPEAERPALMPGPEGTDILFVCRGTPIPEKVLLACFPGRPPPPLPDQVFLQLQRLSRIESIGPVPPKSPAAAQVAEVEAYMKHIDMQLRLHFGGVRAVAFPHRGAESAHEEMEN